MDDPDCDSTWEEDEDAEDGEDGEEAGAGEAGDADAGDEDVGAEDEGAEEPQAAWPGSLQSRMTGTRNWRAMQDMRRYRHHYPDLVERDSNGDMPNLSFYKNEIRFLPNGCFVEDILQNWKDNYELLEDNHSYIQWLFPLREPGVNWHAKPLTLQEVEAFRSSKEVRERLIRAYELMLGFYGIQLEDRDTGAVCRAQNYHKRFQNLNWRSHNNLRITRILKSLGELGLEHYQAPLARFFLEETLVRRELPGVRQSALDYFLFAVRCRHQRRELVHFAWQHFEPRCKFVWGPRDKLLKFKPRTIAQPLAGPRQVEDTLQDASPQSQACRPEKDQGEDTMSADGPQALSEKLQDPGNLEGDQEDPANPPSPKESKKRKLEANRREQASGDLGPQGASEVEKIALNLEGCALSQGSQDTGQAEQPCPQPPAAKVAEEVRKRRKVEDAAGGERGAAVPEHPGAQSCGGGGGAEGDPESQAALEQGTPGSPPHRPEPASTGASEDEAEGAAPAWLSVSPGKP
ncbi:opioid growth factor receptor isoform X2 [Octodon degus]|uniref:Opioid growth factor receptor isoform X2 n=1 Tax=Octodon degus TaxID=10160 RepID=A0A6P3FD52_OCTDE|nr:opioid growth factor receptor isoform X2 [Octodon degus]